MPYKILFADDEYWIREKMKTIIPWAEYEFIFLEPAVDGKDALSKVKKEKPDIIITDMDMPFVNGGELIASIKKIQKDIVIFVISGYDYFDYVKEALLKGAINYLLKPIKKMELINTLTQALEEISTMKINEEESLRAASIIRDREMSYYLKENTSYSLGMDEKSYLDISGQGMLLIKVHHMSQWMKKYDYDINKASYSLKAYIREVLDSSTETIFNNIYRSNEFIVVCQKGKKDMHHLSVKILEKLTKSMLSPISIMIAQTEQARVFLGQSYRRCLALLMLRKFENRDVILVETEVSLKEVIEDRFFNEGLKKNLTKSMRDRNLSQLSYLIVEVIGLNKKDQGQWTLLGMKQVLKQLESTMSDLLTLERRYEDIGELEHMVDMAEKSIDYIEIDEFYETIDEMIKMMVLEDNHELTGTVKESAKLAMAYIQENYFEKLDLKTLSYRYNVENSYFSKVFREVAGENLIAYISRVRIERAIVHMKKSQTMNLAEIAYMVGYDEYTYFSKVFKKVTGKTPKEYREG